MRHSIKPPIWNRRASLWVIIPFEVSISSMEFFKDLFKMISALKVIVNFFEIVDINCMCLKKVVCL